MPKQRTSYPLEYRRKLIELVRAGRSPDELAAEFEPSAQTIRNWIAQADRDAGGRTDGLTSVEREELAKLRRENNQLRVEREILPKSDGLVREGGRIELHAAFEFVKAHQAEYPVDTQCRVLNVSISGFYAWRKRSQSQRALGDAALSDRIVRIHRNARETYRAPRIHAELRAGGERVSRKRVARLMRCQKIVGASRRRGIVTTRRGKDSRPAPDLVDRNFKASAPNQLWVADITYIPTMSGFLFLAIVLDVSSRRIVGWAMATHLRTELVLDTLGMALKQRTPRNIIHHSDQGTQYTSIAFRVRVKKRVCGGQWVPSAIAMITPWPKANIDITSSESVNVTPVHTRQLERPSERGLGR